MKYVGLTLLIAPLLISGVMAEATNNGIAPVWATVTLFASVIAGTILIIKAANKP